MGTIQQWVNRCLAAIKPQTAIKDDWASAAESVTRSKQLKIINAAKHYLQQRKIYDLVNCRFDVVAIDQDLNEAKLNWIAHAFY